MTGLIVAGFHRSGTSSVAQSLNSHGISLGEDLVKGNEFNIFGHFESQPVVQFHDDVLNRVGADWSTELHTSIEFTLDEKRWVRDYAEHRGNDSNVWALKDPRMCRFMHQWKNVVKDIKFLIIYRSPADTCQSLNRRENLKMARSGYTDHCARRFYHDPDLALRLWVEHNRHLIELQRDFPEDCMVLGHHHLLMGYPMMTEMERCFGIRTAKRPKHPTIDPNALSKKAKELFVIDSDLIDATMEVWRSFELSDVAVINGQLSMDITSSVVHDPTGGRARSYMTEIQFAQIYEHQAKTQDLLTLAKPIIRKLSKPPFSFYFKNRKKYRDLIERILQQ